VSQPALVSPAEPTSPPRFEPYIPATTHLPELTARALVMGTFLGAIFGMSSLYLVLKVGLTVSASIPVAVISIAGFRAVSKLGRTLATVVGLPIGGGIVYAAYQLGTPVWAAVITGAIVAWLFSEMGKGDASILENNIVQTAGSAGESIAFGVGVTMPAIMILGFSLEATRVLLVAVLGGALGILMMIPLRRALIVQQHGVLKYPEGTACAVVLKAGASPESQAAASEHARAEAKEAEAAGLQRGTNAKAIFIGLMIGLVYKALNVAFKGWKDAPEKVFGPPLKAGSISAEISPELLGVGYVIGPYIGALMAGGGVLSYLLLIPMIKFFGEGMAGPLAPGTIPIRDMSPGEIRGAYILYIGAGAVAAAGIVSLVRSLPLIWHGLQEGLKDMGAAKGAADVHRTDRDMSMKVVGIGIIVLIAAITLAPQLHMNLLGAILIVVFGFLFVTVSSRLTGEIGSTSNPISGMTVATLLLTCLIFLVMGWTGGVYYVTALSVGAIVCIASSNGGTTSQDLKTGFLVGATPRLQQIAILFGATVSALMLGPILLGLNDSAIVYVPAAQVAPGLVAPSAAATEPYKLVGPQAKSDSKEYRLWHKTDSVDAPAGQYLLDEGGRAVYLLDPGINGTHLKRPDGTEVRKFDAPKATLMSYIIKGILDRQLPWGLVLFGVVIALMLEMCAIPALAFAVGVYLPLSTSSTIFIGGLIRGLVDWQRKRAMGAAGIKVNEEQLAAEADKSSGVLLASGYIAGGTIAGIIIAFTQGVLTDFDKRITEWATASNPFFEGPNADLLAMIPFLALCVFLYFVARDVLLKPKPSR
jgi:putative OPT family oligopeptide transporter